MAEAVASPAVAGEESISSTRWWNKPVPERPLWKDILHIFAIFNFAIAYPLLDSIGHTAWTFMTLHATALDVIMMVVILSILVPAILAGCLAIGELVSSRARKLLHLGFVSLILIMGAIFAIARQSDFSTAITFGPVAIVAGILITFLYLRFEAIQLFATFLILSLIAVPAHFLLNTGVTAIVFPDDPEEVAAPAVESDIPVVLIVYDELPLVSLLDEHGEIDEHRYPNFARLASDSHWFSNGTTVQLASRFSVPSILSGTYPHLEGLPTLEQYPKNLFTLLESSHHPVVNEAVTMLCPESMCDYPVNTFSERLAIWHSMLTVQRIPPDVTAHERDQSDEDFAQSISTGSEPELVFHHGMLPHWPWIHLPSGALHHSSLRQPVGISGDGDWTSDDWLVMSGYQRHLLQVGYVDKLLGELLDRLDEEGIYDDALVILVSDHGGSFLAGESFRRFDEATLPGILKVPFFVKLPDQSEPVVSDRNVQTIDILPTVVDVLDIDVDWNLDGVSVFADEEQDHKTVIDASEDEPIILPAAIDGGDEILDIKIGMFGDGRDPDGLFRIGPYQDLFGVAVSDLSVQSSSGAEMTLDHPDRFTDVDLDDSFVPALIEGSIESVPAGEEESTYLALSVNGTVYGFARTYEADGDVRFTAMVPEHAIVEGDNRIELFIVDGPEDSPVVTSVVIVD